MKKILSFLLPLSMICLSACGQAVVSPFDDKNAAVSEIVTSEPEKQLAEEFDFENKTVMLNSGYEMPIIGLGTWTQDDETVENSVYHALQDGYRLIDTARYYGNEEGVGKGVRRAIDEGIVTREEVFVTSKLVPGISEDYEDAIDACNERLGDRKSVV